MRKLWNGFLRWLGGVPKDTQPAEAVAPEPTSTCLICGTKYCGDVCGLCGFRKPDEFRFWIYMGPARRRVCIVEGEVMLSLNLGKDFWSSGAIPLTMGDMLHPLLPDVVADKGGKWVSLGQVTRGDGRRVHYAAFTRAMDDGKFGAPASRVLPGDPVDAALFRLHSYLSASGECEMMFDVAVKS